MADAQKPRPDPGLQGRWQRIILLVSLSFNLLIICAVGAAHIAKQRPDVVRDGTPTRPDARAHSKLPRSLGLSPYFAALEPSQRRALADVVRDRQGSLRQNRRELRRQFESVRDVLGQDPLDQEALRKAFRSQRDVITASISLGEELLIQEIISMSPSQRASYAERLGQRLRRAPSSSSAR